MSTKIETPVKKRTAFGRMVTGNKDVTNAEINQAEDKPTQVGSILNPRLAKLSELKEKKDELTFYYVDPARCRMWERHNRVYDLLNKERCSDLLNAIESEGKQLTPAVVRRVMNDENYDYEVIAGARRHWCVSYLRKNQKPDILYYIDVQVLTDEQAFQVSDNENRPREDISDYERGLDYASAKVLYYKNDNAYMAEKMLVDPTWLSNLIKMADLDERIVAAYPDITHIRAHHAKELRKLMASNSLVKKILTEADNIKREQDKLIEEGKTPIAGKVVFSRLKSALRVKSSQAPLYSYQSDTGRGGVTVKKLGGKGIQINVTAGLTSKDLLAQLKTIVDKVYEEK